jgi:hypothetical protein
MNSRLPVVTQEIQIVDSQGNVRILLSTKAGAPAIQLLQADGRPGAEVLLNADGRPAVKLANSDATGPAAILEVDDKGAHIKLDRPGGASSYLFLNNTGGSGVVLLDTKGKRRLNVLIDADGTPNIECFAADGKPVT